MGCSYTAYAVIGVRIDKAKLYREVRVKIGNHDIPDDGVVLFHPKTGKPLYKTSREPIEAYDDSDCPPRLYGFRVVSTGDDDDGYIYAGTIVEVDGNDDEFLPFRDMRTIYSDVPTHPSLFHELESSLGELWDEKLFGLWAIGQISC
jgi:hypothetical protein